MRSDPAPPSATGATIEQQPDDAVPDDAVPDAAVRTPAALVPPFALVQGYTFKVTRSLTYIVCVHLLFDPVLFAVLVHAHNPQWLDLFVY